ncbi:hydrogenase small subunit [Lebetimonas natsushimae]|uniref:Hydrogenase small subunit n=1 Tax=Lebetimonas natsushimae TaxID=1936991 RepID=A0A292YDT9_9BACT|nr:hydrogenase [Lebetimonas natsushimae]GAX87531.1 hydrogenase small subunit [Lebetimonas natsushimae]
MKIFTMRSKLDIIWIDAVGCNGCSHSFLNYPYLKEIYKKFNFLYHPLIDSPAFKLQECDILIVEGALKNNFPRLGYNINDLIRKLIVRAKNVIALGTCAVYGGIFGEGLMYNKDLRGMFYKCKDKIINIPGCPVHYDWLVYVLDMIYKNKKIVLDNQNRPKEIFSFTSHSGCSRNEYFEWKIDAQSFGTKEGCLFYEQGCQGPYTHSTCNRILWNEVSSKPRAGTPCFGCTESGFPKIGLFTTDTFMGIPSKIPLGVSKRAYLTISGMAKSLKNERLSKKLIDGCNDEDNKENS